MRKRQSVSIEKGPFNRYPTCQSKSIRGPLCYRHLAICFGYVQEHLYQSILVLFMQIQLLTPF